MILLSVLEAMFVLFVVVGVGLWSVPAGLVVAGVLGVIAIERAQAQRGTP